MGLRKATLEAVELSVTAANPMQGKRILVTGHTGFKGSWLVAWLQTLGADVVGLALPPVGRPNHWDCLGLDIEEHSVDIRNAEALASTLVDINPEFVFHLAAQAFVRPSYDEPLLTWDTNVMGTANLLDGCRALPVLRAVLVATSDKCYLNREWDRGYTETDHLGGHDPYSASKAGAELVAASYRNAFFSQNKVLIATARAGNVIGGGDWSADRLIPDAVRARETSAALAIRAPQATRPWQHVLDALSGYIALAERLLEGDASCARAWNFGPAKDSNRSVAEVLEQLQRHWPELHWHPDTTATPHEAKLLYLDSGLAHEQLRWKPRWGFEDTVNRVADWYDSWSADRAIISHDQLKDFEESKPL